MTAHENQAWTSNVQPQRHKSRTQKKTPPQPNAGYAGEAYQSERNRAPSMTNNASNVSRGQSRTLKNANAGYAGEAYQSERNRAPSMTNNESNVSRGQS